MTNTTLFTRAIDRLGISISELARRSNTSRARIYAIKSGADATASEIVGLSRALLLADEESAAIFLGKNVPESDKQDTAAVM